MGRGQLEEGTKGHEGRVFEAGGQVTGLWTRFLSFVFDRYFSSTRHGRCDVA